MEAQVKFIKFDLPSCFIVIWVTLEIGWTMHFVVLVVAATTTGFTHEEGCEGGGGGRVGGGVDVGTERQHYGAFKILAKPDDQNNGNKTTL